MYMYPGLSMAEVDIHVFRLEYIGTFGSERFSDVEHTQCGSMMGYLKQSLTHP